MPSFEGGLWRSQSGHAMFGSCCESYEAEWVALERSGGRVCGKGPCGSMMGLGEPWFLRRRLKAVAEIKVVVFIFYLLREFCLLFVCCILS